MTSISSTLEKINSLFKKKIGSTTPTSSVSISQPIIQKSIPIQPAATVIMPSKINNSEQEDDKKPIGHGFTLNFEDMKAENVEEFEEEKFSKYNAEEEKIIPIHGMIVENNDNFLSSVHDDLIKKKVSRIAMASKTQKIPDSAKSKKQLFLEKEEERIKQKTMRKSAGEVWVDSNMSQWQDNDYRMFCGNLGNEVTDDVLSNSFKRYSSFSRARVVRDKRSQKTKGYGFVSFLDPQDYLKAFKEMQGKYIGNRPVKLQKSDWETRSFSQKKGDELGNDFLRKGIKKSKQSIKH